MTSEPKPPELQYSERLIAGLRRLLAAVRSVKRRAKAKGSTIPTPNQKAPHQ